MALSKLLLLQALFFSLLLLMVPSQCQVDLAPTRSEISQATDTICSNTGSVLHRKIQCVKFPELADEQPQALSQILWETLHKGSILIIVFGILLCLVSFITSAEEDCVHWAKDEENLPVPNNADGPTILVKISFKNLERITNKFKNTIGAGGFGKVCRGQSSIYGQVAVKQHFKPLSPDLKKAFDTELETLSRTRHQNVVRLVGYCKERNEQILVYEFISRKDLYGYLHPAKKQKGKTKLLSWKLRVKVLLGAARGIEYLHKKAEPRIIQRDIKSENILIDENWVAKISDFGLAVFGPEQGNDYVELEVANGTAGYMDPECNDMNKRANTQNDVFSFGMVILEVVTGKDVLEASSYLIDTAVPSINSDRLNSMLDDRLPVPMGCEMEAITKVAQLATQCVMVPGVDRPDMTVVVTTLEGALALFDP